MELGLWLRRKNAKKIQAAEINFSSSIKDVRALDLLKLTTKVEGRS
jgi:hypothetical protein